MRVSAIISLTLLTLCNGCYQEALIPGYIELETPDWSNETHGGITKPDYAQIFPSNAVQRIDIIVNPEDWSSFWTALEEKLGPFGTSQPGLLEGTEHPYIPADLFYEGKQWYKVGLRAKGNSSLKSSWKLGSWKLPFKLDFDQFEDQYTGIHDQRFYGFEQLSLKNGFSDPSLIREKIIDELFLEAGLPSVRAAYYRLYIDYGEGQKYFGLYTLLEDVDDSFVANNFLQTGGMLYKPEGQGAKFSKMGFNTSDFEVHHPDGTSTYEDIENLHSILHADQRVHNPAIWRNNLDSVFNTEVFIRWLALNTTVQNWDTYGTIGHNYYLYNEPTSNKMVWIHWDNNEALSPGKFNRPPLEFNFRTVNEQWPLIRFLMDDEIYAAKFKNEVQNFIINYFHPERILPILKNNQDLIAPFVLGPDGESPPYSHLQHPNEFIEEGGFLRNFVRMRYRKALEFIQQ